MSNDTFLIRPADAAAISGYSVYMIRQFAREGAFLAYMPRGKRGGYEIVRPSFEQWFQAKRAATSNRRAA